MSGSAGASSSAGGVLGSYGSSVTTGGSSLSDLSMSGSFASGSASGSASSFSPGGVSKPDSSAASTFATSSRKRSNSASYAGVGRIRHFSIITTNASSSDVLKKAAWMSGSASVNLRSNSSVSFATSFSGGWYWVEGSGS
jgi:hypothetical protein